MSLWTKWMRTTLLSSLVMYSMLSRLITLSPTRSNLLMVHLLPAKSRAGAPRRIPRPEPFLLLDRLHVQVALDLTDLRADLVLPQLPQLRQLCGDDLQGVQLAGPACLFVHLPLLSQVGAEAASSVT